MTPAWPILIVVCACAGMQISRPGSTHDARPVSLDTNPARDHSHPFVFACADVHLFEIEIEIEFHLLNLNLNLFQSDIEFISI